MKFINRKNELSQLENYYKLSKKGLFTLAISGLRRVGKTTLVKEFIKDKKALYFFVYDAKSSLDLFKEFTNELKEHKILTELEEINSWHIFFKILFERCHNYVIVFDEFQNFYTIDKTVYSILQRMCDENKKVPINIIILGSLIGLFKHIFEANKEPLYGRISANIHLEPFTIKYSMEALKHLKFKDFENMLNIYGVFGGFPKYYAVLEQFDLIDKDFFDIIEYLFIQENAPLENEVMNILKQEFGNRSALFYSILHSIASGKNRLSEIAANVGTKESSITRHLNELEEKFALIKSHRPIDNKKSTQYIIVHPLISFWFRFVYEKFSDYKLNDNNKIMKFIKENFKGYFGRRFEDICRDTMREMKHPFDIEYIENWWGFGRENDVRISVEIDLIALNSKESNVLFVECKWQNDINGESILRKLEHKTSFFNWRKDSRKDYFYIFGKSFNKCPENASCIDLNKMKRILC